MGFVSSVDIEGKRVVSQDGRDIGRVEAIEFDAATWRVHALEVRAERNVLEQLRLKRPLIGTVTVRILVEHVSGLGDTVVLRQPLADAQIVGSTPAEGG